MYLPVRFRARVPVLVQPPLPLYTLQVMDRLGTFPNLHGVSFLLRHAEEESGSNCPAKTKKESFSQTSGRHTGYKGVSFHHPRRVFVGVCSRFHFWATLSTRSRRTALVGTYQPDCGFPCQIQIPSASMSCISSFGRPKSVRACESGRLGGVPRLHYTNTTTTPP